jgi:hypothetical protein
VVQCKIEELQQAICQMQKDHQQDREETSMQCKVALEQAEEYHNKASNERERLASENNKHREEFMEAVKRQGASLEGEVKLMKEDVGQKKAEMVLLQTELDRAHQLHHETVASLEGEVK